MSQEQACESDHNKIIIFKSLTSEYELYCEKRYLKEFGEFLLIIFASLMTIFLSIIQDLFGRKSLEIFSFPLAIFGFLLGYFGTSFFSQLLGLMLLWSYMEVVSIASIELSNELLINPFRNLFTNITSIFIFFSGLLGNYLTNYLTSYKDLFLIIFISYFFGIVLVMLLLPESPSYLLKKCKIDDLKKVILSIAKTNGLATHQLNKAMIDLNSVIERKFNYLYNF